MDKFAVRLPLVVVDVGYIEMEGKYAAKLLEKQPLIVGFSFRLALIQYLI